MMMPTVDHLTGSASYRWLGVSALAVVLSGSWALWERGQLREQIGANAQRSTALARVTETDLAERALVRQRDQVAWADAEALWRNELGLNPATSAPEVAPARTAAFFAWSRGSAQLRRDLVASGATVADDEAFGFSAYRVATPAADTTAALARQWQQVAEVLGALPPARPHAWLSIKREPVDPEREPGEAGRDWFSLDPRLRPTVLPAGTMMSAYRVDFAGETDCLRQFLRGLGGRCPDARVVWIEVLPFADPAVPSAVAAASAVRTFRVTLVRLRARRADGEESSNGGNR